MQMYQAGLCGKDFLARNVLGKVLAAGWPHSRGKHSRGFAFPTFAPLS